MLCSSTALSCICASVFVYEQMESNAMMFSLFFLCAQHLFNSDSIRHILDGVEQNEIQRQKQSGAERSHCKADSERVTEPISE